MRIDNAIKEFVEKYDEEAIKSIDTISKNRGLELMGQKIDVFTLKESFDAFNTYLKGYSMYKTGNLTNDGSTPHNLICERTNIFIQNNLFKEKSIPYSELPDFVKSYVEGVKTLLETVDSVKLDMMEADVPAEEIGCINEFVDSFMDKLHESFDPTMDRILWASGYNARKAFQDIRPKTEKKHMFL